MAQPSFVWMLAECGHVSALPPGTSSADALATGPVYELVLRSHPSIKLLYTHTLSSNVNAKASALAGHAVNGDACLVLSPSNSSFASPAVVLDSLLQPAGGARRQQHSPSQPRCRGCTRVRGGGHPRSSGAHADQCAGPGSYPGDLTPAAQQPSRGPSPGSGGRQLRHRCLHAHSSPQQRVLAMRAILGSRNATNAGPLVPPTMGTPAALDGAAGFSPTLPDTAEANGVVPARGQVTITDSLRGTGSTASSMTAAAALVRAVAEAPATAAPAESPAGARWLLRRPGGEAQEAPPCKSARSSGEFHASRRGSAAGADPWIAATAALSLAAWRAEDAVPATEAQQEASCPESTSHGSGCHQQRQQQLPVMLPEAVGAAWMELDDDEEVVGDEGRRSCGDNTAAAVAAVSAVRSADGSPRCRGARERRSDEVEQLAECAGQGHGRRRVQEAQLAVEDDAAAATPAPAGCDGDGAEDAPSAAGGEEAAAAAAAPPQAAAAAVAAAPWGDLASDAVVCVAMQLPQQASQVQAMAAVCRGWRTALLGHTPLLRRVTFSLDLARPLRPAGGPGPRGALSHPHPSKAESTPSAPAAASRGPAPAMASVTAADEAAAPLAVVMSRQLAAGAFLLPSHGARQHDEREHDWEPAAAGGGGGQAGEAAPVEMQAAPASGCFGAAAVCAAAAVAAALPRDGAARSLPQLLLAAAHASNPSAQLVLAQLLEAADDARGSLRWWRKLAQAGDVMATFKMGMASYDGSHGLQPDPESAHLWLGRTVRSILRIDSLSAISLDGHLMGAAAAPDATSAGAGLAAQGPRQQHHYSGGRVSPALTAMVSALDAPQLHILGSSAIVLGYLEFDGVAGRAMWGMSGRSEAVRLFRLAEVCGLTEASAVLGWLYNTGQY